MPTVFDSGFNLVTLICVYAKDTYWTLPVLICICWMLQYNAEWFLFCFVTMVFVPFAGKVLCAGLIASLVVFSGQLLKRIFLAVTCTMVVWNCFQVLPCCSGLIERYALELVWCCWCVCVLLARLIVWNILSDSYKS